MPRIAKVKVPTPAEKALEAAQDNYKSAKEKHEKQATDANTTALAKAKMALNHASTAVNRQRFENVGGNRVGKVIAMIQTLRNVANRRSYEFNDADVTKMFAAIHDELKVTQSAFANALKAGGKEKSAATSRFAF